MVEYIITGGNSGLAKEIIKIISKTYRIQYFTKNDNKNFSENAIYNYLDLSKDNNDLSINL